jgi:hypothetical protein
VSLKVSLLESDMSFKVEKDVFNNELAEKLDKAEYNNQLVEAAQREDRIRTVTNYLPS